MTVYLPNLASVHQIHNVRTFFPARPDQVERYERIRSAVADLMELMATVCPPSRELSLAFTSLETAQFWANAAIARNEERDGQS